MITITERDLKNILMNACPSTFQDVMRQIKSKSK